MAAAVVSAASFVAVVRVSVAFAASVAGVAALPAAVLLYRRAAAAAAGDPSLVAAEVSAVPVPASRIAFLVAADTSDPASRCPYSEDSAATVAEGRGDGRRCRCSAAGGRYSPEGGSPDAEPRYSPAPDFRPDWPAA